MMPKLLIVEDDADIVETTKSYNVYSDNNVKLFNKKNAKGFTYKENYFRRDVIWDKLFKTEFIKKHLQIGKKCVKTTRTGNGAGI